MCVAGIFYRTVRYKVLNRCTGFAIRSLPSTIVECVYSTIVLGSDRIAKPVHRLSTLGIQRQMMFHVLQRSAVNRVTRFVM